MELEKLARQLGAAIQQDKVYLDFQEAMKKNEEDAALNELMGKIKLLQMSYQHEASQETPDEKKLEQYSKEFQGLYEQVIVNENMKAFEEARQAVDEMMNYLTGILAPHAHAHDHECGGECSSCGGCH